MTTMDTPSTNSDSNNASIARAVTYEAKAETAAAKYEVIDAIRRGEVPAPTLHDEVEAPDAVIDIQNFNLWYNQDAKALFDVAMKVPRGAVTALIGPSGCGKSTLLRSINRMNDLIDGVRVEGEITLNRSPIYAPSVDVIELRKRLGMVFQKPNPFPMSIYENVVYPLRIDGERRKSVLDEACENLQKTRQNRCSKQVLQPVIFDKAHHQHCRCRGRSRDHTRPPPCKGA